MLRGCTRNAIGWESIRGAWAEVHPAPGLSLRVSRTCTHLLSIAELPSVNLQINLFCLIPSWLGAVYNSCLWVACLQRHSCFTNLKSLPHFFVILPLSVVIKCFLLFVSRLHIYPDVTLFPFFQMTCKAIQIAISVNFFWHSSFFLTPVLRGWKPLSTTSCVKPVIHF